MRMLEKRVTSEMGEDVESTQKLNPTSEYSFEDAFELTGHGKINHLVLLSTGLIMLNVSMESVGMSHAITAAECELQLNSKHKGLVNAATFIGLISTSFFWGYLSDRLGRRAVMLPALVLSGVFSILSSFSTNVWTLIVFRVLTGCLVAASSSTVYAYLGEMHVNSRRGPAIAWCSIFICFSFILLPGLAWIIIPGKWSFTLGYVNIVPWRVLVWLWCAPGLTSAVVLLFLPESPRFLLATKGPEAALPILLKMYEWNHGGSAAEFPVKKITTGREEVITGGFAGAIKNISVMLKAPLLKCVFISYLSMFTVFMLSSGLLVWVPDILNTVLKSGTVQKTSICQIIQEKFLNASLSRQEMCEAEVSVAMFPITMTTGAVFALINLAIGLLINKLGRKTMYCQGVLICSIAILGAAFVPEGNAASVLLLLALCSGCASTILLALTIDVFPTSLRALAMCVMDTVGRAGAAVGSYLLGANMDLHCQEAFTAFGIFTAVSTILMIFWPKPEKVRQEMEGKGYSY